MKKTNLVTDLKSIDESRLAENCVENPRGRQPFAWHSKSVHKKELKNGWKVIIKTRHEFRSYQTAKTVR